MFVYVVLQLRLYCWFRRYLCVCLEGKGKDKGTTAVEDTRRKEKGVSVFDSLRIVLKRELSAL